MDYTRSEFPEGARSHGVSWDAVIGGALAISSLYLILLALGAGMGLSSVSPWTNVGESASALGATAIAWLIFSEVITSTLGGYLTGRLRRRWMVLHADEVHFRDTANGFLAWSLSLIVSVTLLAAAATSMVGGFTRAAPVSPVETVAAAPYGYYVDALFRSDRPQTSAPDPFIETETLRIFAHAMREKQIPSADQSYLAGIVSASTGISVPEAQTRVSTAIANALQAEDNARKLTAHLLLWIFLIMMMGAFSASLAATFGGRQRERVVTL